MPTASPTEALAWRVADLPESLRALPETGPTYVPEEPKTHSIAKCAKACYNAAVLAGSKDPVARSLADLKARKIIP